MKDLSGFSMDELFRTEVEAQCNALSDGLVALESASSSAELLQTLMRAAHSIKGAARVVNSQHAVQVSHAMEDVFSSAQKEPSIINDDRINLMLKGVDLLRSISLGGETSAASLAPQLSDFLAACGNPSPGGQGTPRQPVVEESARQATQTSETHERPLRVQPHHLEYLITLVSELLVLNESIGPTVQRSGSLVRKHQRLNALLERLSGIGLPPKAMALIAELHGEISAMQNEIRDHAAALDDFRAQAVSHGRELYDAALGCRMRPIADLTPALRRTLHDIAHEMHKQVRLEVTGEDVEADRDLLEFLEAPLTHLIRNAVDHGIEPPDRRVHAGKPAEGIIRLRAEHLAGRLSISLSDDGQGLNFESIRSRIVEAGLADQTTALRLNETELLSFLFLPGFSLRNRVTEISGRGVGLDIVQSRVRELRGNVRAANNDGGGATFTLDLPVSLALVNALFVEIGGEPYAIALSRIDRIMRTGPEEIETDSGWEYLATEDGRLPLTEAAAVLELPPSRQKSHRYVIQLSDAQESHGIIVDGLKGRGHILARPLDPLFGTIREIRTAALLPDGSPVLLIDIDEFLVSIKQRNSIRGRKPDENTARSEIKPARERVLVVDDSVTVREMERNMLAGQGYVVDVAADGMEGWAALLASHYDLLVTDIDMPRMDGIRLIESLRSGSRNRDIPVITVSYKDREEDRKRALDAGAAVFLSKESFLNEDFIGAVKTLLGGEKT